MNHVVMFSGGLGSWITAKRVAAIHDTHSLTLLFADVKGTSTNPHDGEDPSTYEFITQAAADIGGTLVRVQDGRTIWEVFTDTRLLGNSRVANCSKLLKQKPCRDWLNKNCSPARTTVYVGIDWSETHRLPAITKGWAPYRVEAPLTRPPYLTKPQMITACKTAGLTVPTAYTTGFPHNNCQGMCVRAGQAQWNKVLHTNRDGYMYAEAQEQALRDHLGKDVAIISDHRGGTPTPLTLRSFRQRTEQPDELDWGGCGCFTEEQ